MHSIAPPFSSVSAFGALVGCRLPIQSAPMAGVVRDAELPAAVAAAGGHGMFPAAFLQAPYLERVIDDLNTQTRAYGVNFVGVFLDRECLELAAAKAPLVDVFIAEPDAGIVEIVHAGGALASSQVADGEQALTTRTVEVHLTHAYQKLDITSRDQLEALLTANPR